MAPRTKAAATKQTAPKLTPSGNSHLNPDPEGDWVEESDDNGELINFEVGSVQIGAFVKRTTIDLPEDRWQDRDGELQKTADMVIFENEGHRWCTWITFQLNKIAFIEGDVYRLECTDERKANQGNVKVFSVKHRISSK